MKKGFTVVILCCTFALAMGLAACNGSSGSASGSGSGSASSSEQQPVKKTDAELMLGTWLDSYGTTMTFDGESVTIGSEGNDVVATYTIDDQAHKLVISLKGTAEMEYNFVDDDTLELTMDGKTEPMSRVKDSQGASGSTASSSGSSSAQTVDVLPEYLDIDGGITLRAVQSLTGSELATLLKQQGYQWGNLGWENSTTGDKVAIRSADDKAVKEGGYASATGKGDLAKGYVRIVTDARALETTDDLMTVRDAIAPGFTVEDSWIVGGGAYLYNVVSDASGARAILVVVANDRNEAIVEFSTDEYLKASGSDGVDGVINTWRS